MTPFAAETRETRSITRPRLPACLSIAFLACGSPAFADVPTIREQDGIVARLETTPTDAVFSWRFVRRPPALVDRIEATVNGRPAGTPTHYEPFASSGATASVTFLVDTGGLERVREIEAAEESILDTIKSLPSDVRVKVASYNTDYHAIELTAAIADFRTVAAPRDVASNLSLGLSDALVDAGKVVAARRAIYVYTDGFDAELKGLAALKTLAEKGEMSVNFVIRPSMRLVDLATIDEFARATGGRTFTRASDVQVDVASFLMSGASVRFSLDTARRLFWQPRAVAMTTLFYGDRKLTLSQNFEQPVAGPDETIRYLLDHELRMVEIAGLTFLALIGLLPLWILRRRRKSARLASRALL